MSSGVKTTSYHINSQALLDRQKESYEAKLASTTDLLESDKKLALENQAALYQRKIAELESLINENATQHAAVAAEKERLERAMPSVELLQGDLRSKAITERANELTDDIDRCTELSFCRLIRCVDAQIFSGYRQYMGVSDEEVQQMIGAIAHIAAENIASAGDSAIILSGAGTSGRIAFHIARQFNNRLKASGYTPIFKYSIAGGDAALFRSVEQAEDDPATAVDDLKLVETASTGSHYNRILYIGISCGFSATYVGAQLEYAMNKPYYACVALGFNPQALARKTLVSGWGTSFFAITEALLQKHKNAPVGSRRHFVLSPVIGPEAVQGSSRMKGGSATKMLLEIIFSLACSFELKLPLAGQPAIVLKTEEEAAGEPVKASGPGTESSQGGLMGMLGGLIGGGKAVARGSAPRMAMPDNAASKLFHAQGTRLLAMYEATLRATHQSEMEQVLPLMTETLRAGRSIWYLGSGSAALVGMIDASEQVATFGAKEKDVRGFVVGGWEALGLYRGMASAGGGGGLPAVSVEHFIQRILPTASTSDLIVVLQSQLAGPALTIDMAVDLVKYKQKLGFQVLMIDVVTDGYVTPQLAPPTVESWSESHAAVKPADSGSAAVLAAQDAAKYKQAIGALGRVAQFNLLVTLPATVRDPLLPGMDTFGEFALKIVLNTLTTGAQVRIGKVYRSRMIDVRVSNRKLYHPNTGDGGFMGLWLSNRKLYHPNTEVGHGLTLMVISGYDERWPWGFTLMVISKGRREVDSSKPLPKSLVDLPVEEQLARAPTIARLVPIAILLATGKYSLIDARRDLKEGVIIRDLVSAAVPKHKGKK
ncbi:hypothetical protein CYMTET_51158 [Cymbomonas tetramitiformis]|uniref:SIS domain-containing protein n=1 Tax=Cymbomonas tetramitiformis TaxID=36881 RepID=A0AAE0BMW0_9CHLO|nr:hypothetical protein CYMTET_51158 [Cymbomonas tetramitiformis]